MGKKIFLKGLFAAILSITITTIFGSSASYAEAVITRGLFTGEGDVRWEWQKTIDEDNAEEPEQVSIMFYDKPAATTTIVVPSLSDVITAASATSALDTYYVHSADQTSQDAYFTSETRRNFGSHVTKLDMTNTSKVQIMGVKPILNPETEAELVFGENIVIGDGEEGTGTTITKSAHLHACTNFEDITASSWTTTFRCTNYEDYVVQDAQNYISDWENKEIYEQRSYAISYYDLWDDLNLYLFSDDVIYFNPSSYTNRIFLTNDIGTETFEQKPNGVFAGYKLKLTNLENVKYLGWYAFRNATLNESSRNITIKANQTAGEGVFAWTNVSEVSFEGDTTFPAMFRGCTDLSEIYFNDVETVDYETFKDTNLGSMDFSKTNIKTIRGEAFKNAGITEVILDGVEGIGYEAFAYNDIRELVLPKSITYLQDSRSFAFNSNMTKLTVAYDMQTSGTLYPLHAVFSESPINNNDAMIRHIKEVNIIAPYSENEEVKPTHVSYCDYRNPISSMGDTMISCDVTAQYKNIVAKNYFYGFTGMEKLTIGEGFEYIGAQAFYNYALLSNSPNGAYHIANFDWDFNHTALTEINLPETLKGIGFNGLAYHLSSNLSINLPQSLEYIDTFAFYYNIGMHTDVDLPNLKVLGTHAFFVAGVHNVHLYDKLESVGHSPFQSCYQLGDITFDLDLFNPEKNLSSLLTERAFTSAMFGHIQIGYNLYGLEHLVGDLVPTAAYGDGAHKVGRITFTEKAKTAPNGWWTFYGTVAEAIDLSKTGWSNISQMAFMNVAADEILLPENLEEIPMYAFLHTRIKEELVIPETVKRIGESAFNNEMYTTYNKILFDGEHVYKDGEIDDTIDCRRSSYDQRVCAYSYGVKITKLPEGLESIGRDAFSRDDRFTADINLPNLTQISSSAFAGTSTKNITLGSNLESISRSAFIGIGELDTLEIDCDIASIYEGYKNNFMSDLFNSDTTGYGMNGGYISLWEGHDDIENIDYLLPDIKVGKLTIKGHSIMAPIDETMQATTFTIYEIVEGEEVDEYGDCVNMSYSSNYGHCYRRRERTQSDEMGVSLFFGVIADEVDMSEAKWTTIPKRAFQGAKIGTLKLPQTLTMISEDAFYEAEIDNLTMPSLIASIDREAFQYSMIDSFGGFSEGLTTIGASAFYGAEIGGNLVIPSTVVSVGRDAFNAGDADAHYDTVTIKADLDYSNTSDQAVFQMFWNANIDKLVIESSMLPVLGTLQGVMPADVEVNGEMVSPLRADGEPEFHGMTMREVVITALPEITANAFEECGNLEKATFSSDAALSRIDKYAFNNATKLKQVVFGEANNNHDINIEEYAFNNTAIESLGTTDASDFNLAAANFYTIDEHVFSNMPKLRTVEIPNNFNIDETLANAEKFVNGAHITSFTFADDPELESVIINYQIAEIRDGAFLNDEKLAKMFIWGNAEIQESDDLIRDFNNATIPKGTTIFGYSDAPAEAYANAASRDDYDGKFYALDEVLYLTTNKNHVVLNENKDDFDKTGLVLFALRRDGVILESDNWQEYTKAYPRSAANINFEEGRGALGDDNADIAAIVYDAPKPFDAISLTNENFANVDFAFVAMPSSANPLVVINYPDGYTGNIRKATLVSMTTVEEEEYIRDLEEEIGVPNTGAFVEVIKVATPVVSLSAIVIAGALVIARKRR